MEQNNCSTLNQGYKDQYDSVGEVKSGALKNLLNDLSVEYGVDLESLGASLEENVHFSQEDINSLLRKHCEGVLESKPQEPASALVPEELNTRPSVQIEEPNTFEEPEEPNTLEQPEAIEQPDDLKESTIEESRIPEEPQETETPEQPQETNIAEKPEEPNVPKKPSISEKSSTPEPNAQPSSDLINFKASVQGTLNSIQEKLEEGEVYAFQEIIKQCSLEVPQKMTQDFHNRVIHLKSALGDKLPLDNFLDLVYEWYDSQKPTKKHYDLKEKLQQTIQEYQILLNQKIQAGEDPRPIQELLKALEKQSRKQSQHTKTKPKKEKPFQEKCEMGLHEIFLFYAKQQSLLGKTPTFETIEKNLKSWNLAKFMKFCKDFSLTETHKTPHKKLLSRNSAEKAFKKNSFAQKEMHEEHFKKALEYIAQLFFDEEYDKINSANTAKLPPKEKFLKLCEHLECYEPSVYNKKMKGFIPAFASRGNTQRIPENDLSYKFKPKAVRKHFQPKFANKLSEKPQKTPEKSAKPDKPAKASKPAQHTPADAVSVDKNPTQLSSYSKQSGGLTWKGLGDMSPKQLSEEFDINNLIAEGDESEDDYLLSQYPLEKSSSQPKVEKASLKSEKTPPLPKKQPILPPKSLGQLNYSSNMKRNLSEATLQRSQQLDLAAKKEQLNAMDRVNKIADSGLKRASKYIKA